MFLDYLRCFSRACRRTCKMSSPLRQGCPPSLTHVIVIHLRMSLQDRFTWRLQPIRTHAPRLSWLLHIFIQQSLWATAPFHCTNLFHGNCSHHVRATLTMRRRQLVGCWFSFTLPISIRELWAFWQSWRTRTVKARKILLWRGKEGAGQAAGRVTKIKSSQNKHTFQYLTKYLTAH